MGEVFVRIALRILLNDQRCLSSDRAVGNFQYAFRSGGAEKVVHEVRRLLRSNASTHAILVDCRNAFNAIRRQAIAAELQANLTISQTRCWRPSVLCSMPFTACKASC